MSRKLNKNQNGFTIIELLVATVVFSVLLLVMLMAFIRTGDLFYKGVSMSKTQEDARNIVNSISDDIQFTRTTPVASPGVFCVGIHRYMYQLHVPVDSSNFGLERDNNGSKCVVSGCGSGCTHMLDAGMQLNDITDYSSPTACQNGLCTVHIHLIFYGGSPTDLFTGSTMPYENAADAHCKGSLSDTSLCATVDYDSTVLENS